MQYERIKTILQFWFGNFDDGSITAEQKQRWWGKDPAIDKYIQQHFVKDVLAAIAGDYEHWLQEPRGTLALIILVDQFCRHIFRNSAAAFAADPIALQWARFGAEMQQDKQLSLLERTFFYLPFEHAEDLNAQQQSVALYYGLHKQAPPSQKQLYGEFYNYAQQHKMIIEKFGRFPHRNVILHRPSTVAELEFLKEFSTSF